MVVSYIHYFIDISFVQKTLILTGGLMFWGSMSWEGCGELTCIEGIMTKEKYMDILKSKLGLSAEKLGHNNDFIFQHDRDPKHTAKIVQNWLHSNRIEVLDWPAQSPDLNPIEHLWSILKQAISRQRPTNISSLKTIVNTEWMKIDKNICHKLVESMPRRCEAVISAQGGHTKY